MARTTDETYEIRLRMTGTTPLLMNNPQRLANPIDPATVKLQALHAKWKKTKTTEDYEEVIPLEFALALYYEPEIGPHIPARNIVAMLAESGGHYKIGSGIRRGHYLVGDHRVPVEYNGARDIDGMLAEGHAFTRPVTNNVSGRKTTVLKTHPRFDEWALDCTVGFDSQEVPREKLDLALSRIRRVGALGDFRPSYGRFDLEVQ
jgi:hypothetical protein